MALFTQQPAVQGPGALAELSIRSPAAASRQHSLVPAGSKLEEAASKVMPTAALPGKADADSSVCPVSSTDAPLHQQSREKRVTKIDLADWSHTSALKQDYSQMLKSREFASGGWMTQGNPSLLWDSQMLLI